MYIICKEMGTGSIGVHGLGAVEFTDGVAQIPASKFDDVERAVQTIDGTLSVQKDEPKARVKKDKAPREAKAPRASRPPKSPARLARAHSADASA